MEDFRRMNNHHDFMNNQGYRYDNDCVGYLYYKFHEAKNVE